MSKKQQNKKETIDPTTTPEALEKLMKTGGFISKAQADALGLTSPVDGTVKTGSGDTTGILNTNANTTYTQLANDHLQGIAQPALIEKTKSIDFSLNLNFGKKGGKIASQLKAQGYVINKYWIKDCERIRIDLLAMENIKILKKKYVRKAFEKLTEQIGQAIAHKYFGDNVTMKRIK